MGTSNEGREAEIREFGREQAETADAPSFAAHVAEVTVDPETGMAMDQLLTDVKRARHSRPPRDL